VSDKPKLIDPRNSVTASELSGWLGLTRQRVGQLADEGVLQRDGTGFPLKASIRAYCSWQRTDARRADKAADEALLNAARLRSIELKNLKTDGQLIDIDEHDAIFDEAFGMLKAELIGLAARVSREQPLRQKIETEVDGALNRCAARFEERSKEM
jgi:hypothetical protein